MILKWKSPNDIRSQWDYQMKHQYTRLDEITFERTKMPSLMMKADYVLFPSPTAHKADVLSQ